jgi:hypothetical protein
MTTIRLLLLSAACAGCAPSVVPQEPRPATPGDLPPAVRETLKPYIDEATEIERKAEGEARKCRERAAAELKKVQDQFCRDAKLDEAVAVRELVRGLESGANRGPSDGTPAAAREVFQQYEKELADSRAKLEADARKCRERATAELKTLQDQFCRNAQLDDAVAVRDLIRSIQNGVSNAQPDPGYVNNQAGDIGKVFYYEVTGVSTGQSIYGTDVYTTGSHLGMAAVHCGLLKPGEKGVLTVTILQGQASYPATTRHDVTSIAYGQWGVSFKVERGYALLGGLLAANALPGPPTLVEYRGQAGKSFLFEVTGSADAGSVWGTDIYTDDSALARAAVHSGALAVGQKGVVRVTLLPGQDSYPASTRNGVTSSPWGSWTGSYRVEPVR